MFGDVVSTDLGILFRVVVSMVLTGLMGWEREATGKAAGLRTHMLVGLGATLFVSLAELAVGRFHALGSQQFDPIRILEAIIAAVGFLGAGTIFVARGRNEVRGLTTAASLWVTAGVGIAIGLDRYVLAIGSTALAIVVLRVLRRLVDPRDDMSDDRDGDGHAPTVAERDPVGRRDAVDP